MSRLPAAARACSGSPFVQKKKKTLARGISNPHLPTATVAFLRCPARPCSGTIDTRELTAALSGLGFEAKNATVYQVRGGLVRIRVRVRWPRAPPFFLRPLAPQLIAKVDKDGSGQVDFDEVRGGEATRRRRSLLWRRVVLA